ncbi:anti-sigma factor antagonist [Candidatus Omnitrophus magneticus]|uniref:Anti-sigma factor antagonist n=1 Tax=Candidatus Omnitrophus magneticus TaxID=1609969 RepID=A0A0F0CJ51_9BACT|nr:anti-sigma factor antagonist [Candidatus Omnitrophus magneticus]
MSSEIKIIERPSGNGSLTIYLDGNIDEATSPILEKEVEKIIVKNFNNIYFDLNKVNYISSLGIRVLIVAYKKGVKLGKIVAIKEISAKAKEILEVVGVLPLLTSQNNHS